MLLFDWDDENSTYIAAHGVSCAGAEQVIDNEPFGVELQTVRDEERLVQLGETNAGRIKLGIPHQVARLRARVTFWAGSPVRKKS